MDSCVLDTSVIIKSIFKPMKSLSDEVYAREKETHEKCRLIIEKIEEMDVNIYIPKVCIVETAAVIRRIADKNLAIKVSKSINDSYEVIDEAFIFDSAWGIAFDTGCSGFDSYFIALSRIKNALLFTDDGGMHHHAEEIGVDSVLIRDVNRKHIKSLFIK
jgi:predicted nucleic acid-binding protein